jgi:small subunit ribosomal protein S26
MVERHKAEMENRIRREDLEKAIETALANPVDFEFAIDTAGNIFRGRTTKSKKLNPTEFEKIPLASDGN